MKRSISKILLAGIILLLAAGCSTNATTQETNTATEPVQNEAPATEVMYEPLDGSVCQLIQEAAANALDVDVALEENTSFLDTIAQESGTGCRLTAQVDGTAFPSSIVLMDTLKPVVGAGWNEQTLYQADGPNGTATAFSRDMALMLISVNSGVLQATPCATDEQATNCELPEEGYTVQIDLAQYMADFSLDGQWTDSSRNFTLELYQDWKHIYGHHVAVAQDGTKIDSLDVSIDGMLKGKEVEVQFQSSFTSSTGTALITYVDVNTIEWKIITPPDGEYYLPMEATLTR